MTGLLTAPAIQESLMRGELDATLNGVISHVMALSSDNVVHGRVFGAVELDRLCQEVGKRSWEELERDRGALKDRPQAQVQVCVYLSSEFYKHGGHMRIIEDLIRAQPGTRSVLLLTNAFGTACAEEVEGRFSSLEMETLICPGALTSFEKLKWVQSQLWRISPAKLFLFNHMQDAIAVAAVQDGIAGDVFYYHHCDHSLSLGVHMKGARHIDFRRAGFDNCRYGLGIADNVLIPLTASDCATGDVREDFLLHGSAFTCTLGSYKFEMPYSFSLSELLPAMLLATGGRHLHVGLLGKEFLARLYGGLSAHNIDASRFIHLPYVDDLWSTLIDYKIDLFMDSFPLGGCRAVVEAMGAGVPVLVHHNYFTRLFSNVDLVYPEALCWSDKAGLLQLLSALERNELLRLGQLSRQHYDEHHCPSYLQSNLKRLYAREPLPQPDRLPFYERSDYRAFLDLPPNAGDAVALRANADLMQAIRLIDQAFPFISGDQVDKGELSRLLFALATGAIQSNS